MNKGIPFWEQHIEKMVLGLAAVVMLAVLAAIAIHYDAVTAEIDNRTLAPAEVDEVMVGKARELSRQLQPDAEADTEQFLAVDGSGGAAFQKRLMEKGVMVYVRTTRGDDESAACGQLATKKKKVVSLRILYG